jgi:predicted enzyme related to lactoylglutathione lyase
MHKSRLAGFIIDCQTHDLEAAARFWSEALGYPIKPSTDPAEALYKSLDTPANDVHIEVQRVEHPSRVHLDIESDDIEAEVRRLEALGAKRIAQIRTWWVMEAPTGQRFCIVRPQRADFASAAKRWPD